jgi:hypothetical protein
MDALEICITTRPRCPSQSELLERAFADGPADLERRANKASCSAIALQHRLDQLLDRHRGWDGYPEHRARSDARRYGRPPMGGPDGWVEFSHCEGRVLSVR